MLDSIAAKIAFNNRPRLIVISGPSGVGKDAVLQELKKRQLPFHYVVTMTSRPPRVGETDGVDYIFTSKENFESLIQAGEFAEWAEVYGQYKGIPCAQITKALQSGKDALIRVDVQGSRSLRKLFPDAVLIFLVADNDEEWYRRLRDRKTDTPEQLKVRMQTAKEELTALPEFDYLVVNAFSRLADTADSILAIIKAEHLRNAQATNQDQKTP